MELVWQECQWECLCEAPRSGLVARVRIAGSMGSVVNVDAVPGGGGGGKEGIGGGGARLELTLVVGGPAVVDEAEGGVFDADVGASCFTGFVPRTLV